MNHDRTFRFAALGLRVVLLACPIWAQEGGPGTTPPTLVNLTVMAEDVTGRPVSGLSAADVRILDNGRPQTIVSFRWRGPFQAPSVPLGPRQFSNRSAIAIPHATVILFDLMNMQIEDRTHVFNLLTQALERFDSSDNLYLYLITLDGGLSPVRVLPGGVRDATVRAGLGGVISGRSLTRPCKPIPGSGLLASIPI